MRGNAKLFQKSITQELEIIKNRVRSLIGDAHWGEEGRFKEAILKNSLRQFLPKNLSVGTGFILKSNGNSDEDNILSSQLDIIVYDNTVPILFSEGDFVITTITNVKAVIEVKSKITPSTIKRIINKFDNSISNFITEDNKNQIFLGLFSFEFEGDFNSVNIVTSLKQSQRILNHISLGTNYFIKKWQQVDAENLSPRVVSEVDFYNTYTLESLSFSYFISNLIDISSGGLKDRYWFSFPINDTKEIFRNSTVYLD